MRTVDVVIVGASLAAAAAAKRLVDAGLETIVLERKELPRHKIVFGTDSPPNEPGMWLRELEVLCGPPPHGMNLDEDGLEDYMGNNIARMCGIKTTPPPRTVEEAQGRLKDTYFGVK